MAIFRLELPIVPSLNMAYLNNSSGRGRGRIPARHTVAWKTEAGWLIRQANPPKIKGAFRLTVLVPVQMRGDVDNRLKLVADLIGPKGVGLTPDDRHAVEATCRRDAAVPPKRCVIMVEGV